MTSLPDWNERLSQSARQRAENSAKCFATRQRDQSSPRAVAGSLSAKTSLARDLCLRDSNRQARSDLDGRFLVVSLRLRSKPTFITMPRKRRKSSHCDAARGDGLIELLGDGLDAPLQIETNRQIGCVPSPPFDSEGPFTTIELKTGSVARTRKRIGRRSEAVDMKVSVWIQFAGLRRRTV